jgi:hypothetical protein
MNLQIEELILKFRKKKLYSDYAKIIKDCPAINAIDSFWKTHSILQVSTNSRTYDGRLTVRFSMLMISSQVSYFLEGFIPKSIGSDHVIKMYPGKDSTYRVIIELVYSN